MGSNVGHYFNCFLSTALIRNFDRYDQRLPRGLYFTTLGRLACKGAFGVLAFGIVTV